MMEWLTKSISDVICKTKTVDPRKSPEKGFQYVDVSGVSNKTLEVTESTKLLGENAPSRARRLITEGDVIFATVRPTLRRIAIIPASLDGEVCSTGYFVFQPKSELYNRYLYYFLQSDHFMNEMEKLQAGASYPAVNDSQVKSRLISYPPISEQKRIVALLDTVFADLEQTRAKTEQNLKNARELFDSYLQQVFSQKGEGCEQVALSEITESISDGDHSAPPKSDKGIPFITISNINKKTLEIDFSNTFKVPEGYYSALKSIRKPKIGDVLYTVTGSYGIPVMVNDNKEFCFQRYIGLVRPNKEINSQWLYYLLMSPQVFNQADNGATGTAQKTVSLKLLRSIIVPNIALSIQKEMVKGLGFMYQESKNLENIYTKKLNSIDELKKSILQKAFSGELTTDKNIGSS
ncbi:MAG: restriction endonuclease subunit S [Colwellia sp.]|nr:restriction endonuclease subunit S [Colwellia sp.]